MVVLKDKLKILYLLSKKHNLLFNLAIIVGSLIKYKLENKQLK